MFTNYCSDNEDNNVVEHVLHLKSTKNDNTMKNDEVKSTYKYSTVIPKSSDTVICYIHL